ncbi:hypothetical protein GPALN_004622 [Globodera pallida]|nr:hypothetical protein GPALN_004622 [Globodera pallida]
MEKNIMIYLLNYGRKVKKLAQNPAILKKHYEQIQMTISVKKLRKLKKLKNGNLLNLIVSLIKKNLTIMGRMAKNKARIRIRFLII